jgi:hypothetical protein
MIRLRGGEDIICVYKVEDKIATLENPLMVMFQRSEAGSGMIFMPWLPVELITENIAVLDVEDVMLVLEPRQSLVAYYHTQIEKIQRKLEADDGFFDDSVDDEPTDEELNTIDMNMINQAIRKTLH